MEMIRANWKLVVAFLLLLALGAAVFLAFRRPEMRQEVDLEAASLVQHASTPAEPTQGAGILPSARSYEIVTLLPKDAIPSIDDPQFYDADEADAEYAPDELVLGVTIDGESKAYSSSHLDSHEIVNDTLGGRKIAVTW